MSSVRLCDLPSEVLDQILDYSIPVCRLTGRSPTDPEWTSNVNCSPKQLPALMIVNKQLSKQATDIFYAKAILELTPIKPPLFMLNRLGSGQSSINFDLASDVALHHYCPSASLLRIRTVHMYTGQSDAIAAEGYEATLRLLIQNTAVRNIHLSRMVMNRLRKARVNASVALHTISSQQVELVRSVYIWTKHPRSFWERTRRKEMSKISGISPPYIQIYLYEEGANIDPILDPRWDVKSSDSMEFRTMLLPLVEFLDITAARDPVFASPAIIEETPDSDRLYQLILVVRGLDRVPS
jgi:hypothetical protein